MRINDPGMGELFDYDKWLDEQPSMTPQPTIDRLKLDKRSYELEQECAYLDWYDKELLNYQYFQLLTDLSTVIAYFRYSWETRDYKAALHNLRLRDSMSDADVTVGP